MKWKIWIFWDFNKIFIQKLFQHFTSFSGFLLKFKKIPTFKKNFYWCWCGMMGVSFMNLKTLLKNWYFGTRIRRDNTRLKNLDLWELFLSKLLFLILIFTILADKTGRFSNLIQFRVPECVWKHQNHLRIWECTFWTFF